MQILYLTKAFPYREYKISSHLKSEISCEIMSVAFSRKYSEQINKFNNSNEVFLKNFDYTRWLESSSLSQKNIDEYNKILSQIEKELNIPSLSLCVYADRYLVGKDDFFVKKHICCSYYFLKELIEQNNINVIIGEISSATDMLAYFLSKIKNIKYIFPWHARQKNKLAFTDQNDRWLGLEEIYKDLLNNTNKVNLTDTAEFIKKYINEKQIPDYMKFADKTKKEKIKEFGKGSKIDRIKEIILYNKIDKKNAIDYDHSITNKVISRLTLLKNRANNFNSFFSEQKEEKFILFPLHYQPEASTMTLAPYYLNQLSFIENISKSLPINYYLYVKEHPAMFGARSKDFYKSLKRLYNVKLIDSRSSIHDLIADSSGVITITNTTGYEAIIYDKPLFTFGNVFYDIYAYCFKPKNFEEFRILFPSILKNWENEYETRLENRLKFIKAVNESIYNGNMNSHLKDLTVLHDKNLEVLSHSIIKAINHE